MTLPLHIPPLRPPQRQNTILHKNIQAKWIYSLLVDDNKGLLLPFGVDRLIADKVFEFDDLLQLGVDELALRLDELFPLLGRRIEET